MQKDTTLPHVLQQIDNVSFFGVVVVQKWGIQSSEHSEYSQQMVVLSLPSALKHTAGRFPHMELYFWP